MKSTYGRNFITVAMILLIALTVLGASFQMLVKNYLTQNALSDLRSDAEAIATFDVMDVDSSTGEIRTQSTQVAPESPQEAQKSDGVHAPSEEKNVSEGSKKRGKGKNEPVDAEYTDVKPVAVSTEDDGDGVVESFFS